MRKSLVGFSYGYDLSAATDRLPIDLQVAILSPIIGAKAASLWAQLLVGREYILKADSSAVKQGLDDEVLKYSVGQPMGALSSFNMLAVTHHFLVQLAYRYTLPLEGRFSSGVKWYDGYEITGDDVVIFSHEVATQYLSIMKDIGVPINESKSVCATVPFVEYLKVSTLGGFTNVSALS